MVSASSLAGVSLLSLGLVLLPGPNIVYLVSRTLTQGRRAGFFSLLGVGCGFFVYLAAAVSGLVAIFALVPTAYDLLKIVGALYLLYLAWQAVRPDATDPLLSGHDLPPESRRRLFLKGLTTNLLNPKIAVLYVTVLPHFVDEDRGPAALQSLQLGLVQIAISMLVQLLVVLLASSLADALSARPLWLRVQRYVMGGTLAALAVWLLSDRTRPGAA